MILKAKYAHGPAAAKRTKAGIRYVTHRPGRETDKPVIRELFGPQTDTVSKESAYALVDASADRYLYRLMISPGGETNADLRDVARDTMEYLAGRLDAEIQWIGIEHRDHSANDHVHIIAAVDRRLCVRDLQGLRETAARSYEQQLDVVTDQGSEVAHSQDRQIQQEMDR